MPSTNVSEAAEELFFGICECAFDAYRPKIKTESIPLKHNLKTIERLDPADFHRTTMTGREQAAVVASCICNQVEIAPGVIIPRALTISGQVNFIERGASQDIVASAGVDWIPGKEPLNDRFVLSQALCEEIIANFDMNAIRTLQDTLLRQGSI